MKHFLLALLLNLFLFFITPSLQAESTNDSPKKAIVLVSVGPSDGPLLRRVTAFISSEFGCRVRVPSDQLVLKETPEDEAKLLSSLLTDQDIGLVALMNVTQETKFVSAVFGRWHVAFANIRYADSPISNDSAATEIRYRRAEEDAMRSVARLLGLPRCPFQLCALHFDQSSAKQGDVHARNLCPPCQSKAAAILKSLGATAEGSAK